MLMFAAAAVALSGATALAALGQLPWLDVAVTLDGAPVPQAGMYAQIALTVLAVCLCFFLPTNHRVLQLENSHRKFSIGMHDVAKAYALSHGADRAGLFQLSSEYDAVRERLTYLRDHPDLSTLEPGLLEVAAQMSHISRELAAVYSDEKITRARGFLEQRQQEIEQFNSRLDQAKGIVNEIRHWSHEVELEEAVAAAQLDRLMGELRSVMPELGVESTVRSGNTVIDLPKAAE